MKKNNIIIVFLLLILFIPINVFATIDAVISGNDVRIRTNPGTDNSAFATVNVNTPITLENKTLYSGKGCDEKWYKVKYNNKDGYVCSRYVTFTNSFKGINVIDWTARVNANNVTVRTGASVDKASKGTLSLGVNVTILSTVSGGTSDCAGGKWHKISYYSNDIGYICSKYITKKSDIINTTITDEYRKYLTDQGFDESYFPFLNYLHVKNPSWVFVASKVPDSFSVAVNAEEGKNYMQTKNDNYRTSSKPAEGSTWFKVNSGVISFYMDPRNWLTEDRIFMFEKLDYDSRLEKDYITLVKSVFGSGALSDDKYTIPMVTAGKTNNINPVHIASRIKLEVSANGSGSTSGGEFTWEGKKYSGFYNFFNIGAYETTINGVKYSAVTRGLAYAAKLVRSSGSLWNNVETAIVEGSEFLADSYIAKGQGTQYFQKFNVNPNSAYTRYTHQYMTNVQSPAIEGNSSYRSYRDKAVLDLPFVFEIPVYKTMPLYTSLPNSGNTNNDLSSLEVENFSLSPSFDPDIITYESYVTKSTSKVNVKAVAAAATSSISGTGEIALTSDENVITVTVRSEAGEEKDYSIVINKVDDTTTVEKSLTNIAVKTNGNTLTKLKNSTQVNSLQSAIVKNGAKNVTIKSSSGTVITGNTVIGTNSTITIATANETKTFTISVNGDTSGDGKITILDLLQVQKHIKGAAKLNDASLLAADTSGDSKVTILDLLQIQKHIKGASSL